MTAGQGTDPYDLERFIQAQAGVYAQVLAELHAGLKRSHWMWFVFPQIEGLGRSSMAVRYALRHLSEAQAYLSHPMLGTRLQECVQALRVHTGRSAVAILGAVDAQKLHACLTLFALVSPAGSVFHAALKQFFQGQPHAATLERLGMLA
jgi:uncharacterized protein (DUF1810 family)